MPLISRPTPSGLKKEIVYILQRADVEEEMDRLEAHLDAIETALAGNGSCGRRLDFLMQELNREANTLGSKIDGAQHHQHVCRI